MSDSDGKLYLKYLHNNNREALRELFEKYNKSLTLFLYGIVRNFDDAEELMMDTFAVLASKTANYAPKKDISFKTWLYALAHNRAKMFFRKNRFNIVSDDEFDLNDLYSADEDDQPEQSAVINESNEYIYKALTLINGNYRQILFLQFFEQLKPAEISKVMGLNIKKVYNLTTRAKEALKQTLERMGYTWDM